jgi:hypothetical protein
MIGGAWRLYRSHFRLFAGCAAMVTILQALELLYAPAFVIPFVFLALWPVIVGVVSQAVAEVGAGRIPPSVQSVYEGIGTRGFLKLAIANVLLVLVIVLGLCVLVLPGIYLWVRFQFVPQVLVRRRTPMFAAFGESSALVRGRWWRVFGVLLVLYGAATLVNIVAFLGLSAVSVALGWSAGSTGIAAILGMSAVWALMDPIFFGALLLLYLDLQRMRAAAAPLPATLPAAGQMPGS